MANCPQCGTEFTPTEHHPSCPRCGAQAELDRAAEQSGTTRSVRSTPKLTMVLIGINVVVYLAVAVASRSLTSPGIDELLKWGANYGPLTMTGQWWRLETSTFLHGSVFHLLFNMWALLNLGLLAEIIFGAENFLFLYFLSGLSGGVASLWWHPNVVGVGASGAIFGLAGALLPALVFEKNDRLRRAMRGNLASILVFVVYSIVNGAGSQRTDNAAHVGGLTAGLLLGFLLPKATSGVVNRLRSFAAIALIAAVIFGGALYTRTRNAGLLAYAEARKTAKNGNSVEAIEEAKQLVARYPELAEAHDLLANLYMESGKPELAIPELQAVLKKQPDYVYGNAQYCVALLRTKQTRQAITACQKAVQLDPDNSDLQFNLGLTYRAEGDSENAKQAFGKAASLKPNSAEENYWYGIALLENRDYQNASQQFEKVLQIDPKYDGAAAALGEAQRHLVR